MISTMIDRRTFLLSTAAATVTASLERFASLSRAERKVKVACVFSSNVTPIDWVGPEAVFDAWLPDASTKSAAPLFEVFTVGESREIRDPGFNVIPDYVYDDAPQAEIIVVPAQAGSPKFYE